MAETTTVQVVMPAMGDSVSEGTILEWHKQEGDTVAPDETLVEISTDKVDAEVPAPTGGTVVKIYAGEGDTIEVGQPLAEIDANVGDTVTVGQVLARMSAGGSAKPAPAAPEPTSAPRPAATAETPAP